ncbi:MAG: hypothetical protein ACRCTZ_05915 [Sarcina sp.]
MNFKFRDKKIGISKLKSTFFLHIHDVDAKITKSYVMQFSTKHLLDPFTTYSYKYKMFNLLFVRVGYSLFEI